MCTRPRLVHTPHAVCRTRLEGYPIRLQGAFEDGV